MREALGKEIAIHMNEMKAGIKMMFDESLEKVTDRLTCIESKLDRIEKEHIQMTNDYKNMKKTADNILKANVKLTKDNEALNEKLKLAEQRAMKSSQKLDDLEQYGRKCMVELSGLPRTTGEDVQSLFISMTEKTGVTVTADDLEACRRNSTKSDAPIIAEFSRRTLRNKVLAAKKKIQDLKVQDFGFPAPPKDEEGKVFLNESLTFQRKMFLREVKNLKKDFNFKHVWTNKGRIFVRKNDSTPAKHIVKIEDLKKLNE